ncbi:MAG: serine hydrolase [Anaerolineales bacterium]|nr:serine hydrolase [Chloroflexota bacterium]MBL6982592.1 serine hydrolase [Anaerolineales bacterium]
MRSRGSFSLLRWISIFLILFAVILATIQVASYSRTRAVFPPGMKIAQIHVGGLDRQATAQRLLEVYTLPVELHYNENIIHLDPSVVGFEIDLESMLAAADLERTRASFWVGFWDYLWGRRAEPSDIPLRSSFSEARLHAYLAEEIASRYDQPPTAPIPVAGSLDFQPGALGTAVDVERSTLPIDGALRSTTSRVVSLHLERTLPPRPSRENLEILLKQTIDLAEFEGIAGLYMMDLQTNQEIHFARQGGAEIPVHPDVAFTTASIIKIPILISTYRQIDGTPDIETANLIEKMIIESGNETADWLMQREIDAVRAPLLITEDLQALGLENTFLAGHFYLGAPVLDIFQTPANLRTDVYTNPDIYNQTTPSDLGMLLEDLYLCAETGGGSLPAVFGGEIDQEECKSMVTYLTLNKMPSLLEAGIPEGTQIAHKHGWVTNDGIINLIGDAGLIYTIGGDYVLVIFLYHPVQLIWDPSSALVGQLSRAVYNYFNLPNP